jgi:hypothetical protein
MRLAAVALAIALGLAGAAACGGSQRGGPPAESSALLKVDCPVTDAMVWVDDAAVGEIAELPRGVRVRPGEHRIEVRHDRFHTRYFMVTLRQGEEKVLRVALAEVLD